ncbi:ABC transporter permease [Chloroflexia bacterium SDU3-3]|nr:ABC transporter permease [Chloroflexia bacterium SDU3-3]
MATVITSRSESVFHYLNPIAMVRHLWQHRDLIQQFTKREIEGRYKGSFLGLFWSFINPLILLLIYTFVFGVVMKSRWSISQESSLSEFALILFCGLIAFNIFSECAGKASNIITSVPNYVKKVVFPLEILPVSTLGSALFHGAISLGILLVAKLIITGTLQLTLLLLPIIMLPLLFLCLGLMWFLASMGVFIRDIGYTVALVLQVLFFLTPIFYPIESIPQPFNAIIRLNPMASIADNFRRSIIWGTSPSWYGWLAWTALTGSIMILGYAWFMKTKKAFADVI